MQEETPITENINPLITINKLTKFCVGGCNLYGTKNSQVGFPAEVIVSRNPPMKNVTPAIEIKNEIV